VHSEDVLFLVEIKSTIRGEDLSKFNNDLKKVKKLFGINPNFKGIIIGFNCNLQLPTLYKRFGYKFNKEIAAFSREDLSRRRTAVVRKTKVDYENIDAVVSLSTQDDGSSSFFIQRTPDPRDENHFVVNECNGDELAFGQFLKMIK
jgi:hypothetical protein